MFYDFPITLDADGDKLSPISTECVITHGIVKRVEVLFPRGCIGLVGIAIDKSAHQVWPNNSGSYFISDGETIAFNEDYPVFDKPFMMIVRGYNTDTLYPHTVHVRFLIENVETGIKVISSLQQLRELMQV